MKYLIFLLMFSLSSNHSFASMGPLDLDATALSHYKENILDYPNDREVLDYAYKIMSMSYPKSKIPIVSIRKGLSSDCSRLKASAYVMLSLKQYIFICQDYYDSMKLMDEYLVERDVHIQNGDLTDIDSEYKYIPRNEVLKTFGAAIIIHEMLHLMGHKHGHAMYEEHEKIFRRSGVENYFINPHPLFSDWAVFQLGKTRN